MEFSLIEWKLTRGWKTWMRNWCTTAREAKFSGSARQRQRELKEDISERSTRQQPIMTPFYWPTTRRIRPRNWSPPSSECDDRPAPHDWDINCSWGAFQQVTFIHLFGRKCLLKYKMRAICKSSPGQGFEHRKITFTHGCHTLSLLLILIHFSC